MSDEYLWDRSGEPDAEIVQLEAALSRYRHVPPMRQMTPGGKLMIWGAIAAGLAIATALSLSRFETQSEWSVAGKMAAVGQTIETHGAGAKMEAEAVGEILLDPHSRLEILKTARGVKQLALRRGTLHAMIWAPPSSFLVQTPSAATIDLGCSYTLSVMDDNSSFLTVNTGWVAFQKDGLESFIPAGAACRTRPRLGPGLPYWNQSQKSFQEAVSEFDLSGGKKGPGEVLRLSTAHDALTLWHLIRRTSGADREQVVARFTSYIPEANANLLRTANTGALDKAWDSMGLGATGLFRTFQQRWGY